MYNLVSVALDMVALDIAPDPFDGPAGLSCADNTTALVIAAAVALVLIIGVICLVRAVRAEKKAREMKQSADAASQLLNAVTEAQNAAADTTKAE